MQSHFLTFKWGKPGHLEIYREARHRVDLSAQLLERLYRFADPIPKPYELGQGIPHYNNSPEYANILFDVVRAIASRKIHYLTRSSVRTQTSSTRGTQI